MKFHDVLARCVFGTTGYLESVADLDRSEQVVNANLPVLAAFDQVVVATNYAEGSDEQLRRANARMWRSLRADVVMLDSPRNRGHSIGTGDLDNMLIEWCTSSQRRWLCQSANDLVLSPRVLDIDVEPAQFYFINAVSYDAIAQREFNVDSFTGDYFYPQGTFWVMDVDGMDHLVDPGFLDASWRVVNRIDGYSGRIWEHIPGWAYENVLRQVVLRRGLTRHTLLTAEQWRRVLDLTAEHRISDCSLKGVDLAGICHVQGLDDPLVPLAVIE